MRGGRTIEPQGESIAEYDEVRQESESLLLDIASKLADDSYLFPSESVNGICRNLEDLSEKCQSFGTDEMKNWARKLESYIEDVRKRGN